MKSILAKQVNNLSTDSRNFNFSTLSTIIKQLEKFIGIDDITRETNIKMQKVIDAMAFDKKVQLSSLLEQKKTEEGIGVSNQEIQTLIEELSKAFKESKTNSEKLLAEAKKHTKSFLDLNAASAVTAKALSQSDYHRSVKERVADYVSDKKDKLKSMTSLKGFLTGMGWMNADSKGIFATAINRRADRMQYAEDRLNVDPQAINMEAGKIAKASGVEKYSDLSEEEKQVYKDKAKKNLRKTYMKKYDEQQVVKKKMIANEKAIGKVDAEIEGLRNRGFTDEQIARSSAQKKRDELDESRRSIATEYANVDTRMKPLVNKQESQSTEEKETKSKYQPIQSKQETQSRTEKEAKSRYQPQPIQSKQESQSPAEKEIKSRYQPIKSEELANEASLLADKQLSIFKDIEKNTNKTNELLKELTKQKKQEEKDSNKGKGLFDGLLDSLTSTVGSLTRGLSSLIPGLAALVPTVIAAGGAAAAGFATGVVASPQAESFRKTITDPNNPMLGALGGDTTVAASIINANGGKDYREVQKEIDQRNVDVKDAPWYTRMYGIGEDKYLQENNPEAYARKVKVKKAEEEQKSLDELVAQSLEEDAARKYKVIQPGNSDAGAGRGSTNFTSIDPRRLDTTFASDTATRKAQTDVFNKSAESQKLRDALTTVDSTTPNLAVVNAPVTNSNTSVIKYELPVRKDDSTLSSYLGSKFAY